MPRKWYAMSWCTIPNSCPVAAPRKWRSRLRLRFTRWDKPFEACNRCSFLRSGMPAWKSFLVLPWHRIGVFSFRTVATLWAKHAAALADGDLKCHYGINGSTLENWSIWTCMVFGINFPSSLDHQDGYWKRLYDFVSIALLWCVGCLISFDFVCGIHKCVGSVHVSLLSFHLTSLLLLLSFVARKPHWRYCFGVQESEIKKTHWTHTPKNESYLHQGHANNYGGHCFEFLLGSSQVTAELFLRRVESLKWRRS